MIIECEIQKTQIGLVANFRTPYKTNLIERSTITAFIHHTTIKVAMRFVGIKAKTQRNIITSVKSDAGRVCSNSRQICPQ